MATMKQTETKARLEGALDYMANNIDALVEAHQLFGIPLEDLLAGAARRALTARASDGIGQLNLIYKDTKEPRS
jgi:hypothetical protein